MQIENTEVYGFRSALRAMRNPKNSWHKADTAFHEEILTHRQQKILCHDSPSLGPNDKQLSCALVKAGSVDRKFLRQIIIWVDLTVPRYLWQEIDTYKVATTRNSCSTMHKLGSRDLILEDFQDKDVFPEVLDRLNRAGLSYRKGRDFTYQQAQPLVLHGYDIVRWMKKHLPEGYLQKATYSFSYETALAWLVYRSKHRLPEWSDSEGICQWIRSLPCMEMWFNSLKNSEG